MQLPANLQTGRVEGFFALEILDGPDFDDEPEVIPAEGDVLFTANIPYWPAGAAEMIIVKTEKVVPLVNGWITIPGTNPPPGMNPGVRLFATDDPDYGVVNWQWTATPRLRSSTGVKLLDAVPPIKFNLPTGETINLARVAEAPLTVPAGIVQSESNAAAAASAAQRAVAEVDRLGHLIETAGINSGGGLNISGLLLADPDDVPKISYSPIEVWGGAPTIPGSAGWYREKRIGGEERAPGESQYDSGALDIEGSSYFSYPGTPGAANWSNNPGRVIITELKPGGDAQWAYWLFNLEFVTSSPEVEIFVNASVTNGKLGTILVNGKRISERNIQHTMRSGEGYGVKLTFPSSKERTIRINALNSGNGRWGGVAVQPGFDVKKSTYRPNRRFAVIGDSFVNGTDEVSSTETFVWRLASLMGADELLQVGIGGTGFHNAQNSSTFINRVPAVLEYAPDVLLVAGGRNDPPAGLQAAVEEFLRQVTSIKEVYLITTASDRGQPAVNDALKAAAEAAGVPFIRGDVDFHPREDAVHLTYEAHQAFADELFVKMLSDRPAPEKLDDALLAGHVLSGTATQEAIVSLAGREVATKPLPSRPAKPLVVFSFDDGWLRDMTVVKPVLDEKGIKASFAIVSSYVGSSATQRLNWDQVHQLEAEGHEIMNHSHSHIRLNVTDASVLEREIVASQAEFLAQGFRPKGFVWPFTVASPEAIRLTRQMGYTFGLGGTGSFTQPLGTYNIGRYSLTGSSTIADLKARVDKAKQNNELLIFLTHATTEELNEVGVENLRQIIDYVKSEGIDIVTASEAFSQVGNLVDTEETVIDGSGRLHSPGVETAEPEPEWGRTIWGGGGTVTAATPPSGFQMGAVTLHTVSVTANKDWPETSSGSIRTERLNATSENYTVQFFTSATGKTYVRRGANAEAWQKWVLPVEIPAIPAQTVFLVDAGSPTYLNEPASSYSRGKTLQRVISPGAVSPSGGAGIVETTRMGAGYCFQEFVAHTFGTIWRRSVDGEDQWLPWKQMTLA